MVVNNLREVADLIGGNIVWLGLSPSLSQGLRLGDGSAENSRLSERLEASSGLGLQSLTKTCRNVIGGKY